MRRMNTGRGRRSFAAMLIAAAAVTALGALGGIGAVGGSVGLAQYQYGKVTICHVAGPATPSLARPRVRWKRSSPALVDAPKWPSTS